MEMDMNTQDIIRLETPLLKADMKNLRIGDVLELTGIIYTARDAAHGRMYKAWKSGEEQPVDFTNQFVFYAGPCPAKPGRACGPIAPTTSMRMDSFVEMSFELGMLGMIGKGDRSGFVPGLCKKYGGVYLLAIGGASALISNQVKKSEVVAYADLGTESIKRLTVDKLRLVVGYDTCGGDFFGREIAKYSQQAPI
ncbi:MAG: FumA C-terminus/TtdB family hydratase beta subunit [Oscillospiraceae bacterium]|nr:FumA C-terminus/TtdB family hydratase beta subunit [Oscillospiraceae bacterium]